MVAGCSVIWSSKLQTGISWSTKESKYVALSTRAPSAKEHTWGDNLWPRHDQEAIVHPYYHLRR
eukprot:12195150-Ditylum_brightwellii.AAC.1